jgi:hypothetical protein
MRMHWLFLALAASIVFSAQAATPDPGAADHAYKLALRSWFACARTGLLQRADQMGESSSSADAALNLCTREAGRAKQAARRQALARVAGQDPATKQSAIRQADIETDLIRTQLRNLLVQQTLQFHSMS